MEVSKSPSESARWSHSQSRMARQRLDLLIPNRYFFEKPRVSDVPLGASVDEVKREARKGDSRVSVPTLSFCSLDERISHSKHPRHLVKMRPGPLSTIC